MSFQNTSQNSSKVLHRSTISVSVPPLRQEAFYRALIRLKQDDGAAFVSASALIVEAVIQYADTLDQQNTLDMATVMP